MGEDTRSPAELAADIDAADLAAGDGRVRRLAQIAIRHANDHRLDEQMFIRRRGHG
jgi:Zn-dependent protease with chaperone function